MVVKLKRRREFELEPRMKPLPKEVSNEEVSFKAVARKAGQLTNVNVNKRSTPQKPLAK